MNKIIPGHIYPLLETNDETRSKYVCLEVIDETTYKLMRLGDGWTLEAHYAQLNDNGYIHWGHSTAGHWPEGTPLKEELIYDRYQRHVMENAINIALTAGALKQDGKIDARGGHNSLAYTIVGLAKKFEREMGSKTDYNAPPDFENLRDYWNEIDQFAEAHLKEKFSEFSREPIAILLTYPESNGELQPELIIMKNPDEDFEIDSEAIESLFNFRSDCDDDGRLGIRDVLIKFFSANCQEVSVYPLPDKEIEIK